MLFRSTLRGLEAFKRPIRGVDFARNRFTNKGTAFTMAERNRLNLKGILPTRVETLDDQVERYHEQLCLYNNPINRYQLLRNILDSNVTLHYAIISRYLQELLPVIYTPTVGEACQRYSNLYQRDHAMYISLSNKGSIDEMMTNLRKQNIEVIVITDGSRILGLGDLGVNGVGISLGKCSLYVAAGGIRPSRVLPVVLDVGTNNEELLGSAHYLGICKKRCGHEEFYALLDEFMESASKMWPGAVIQFEDFSNDHCFDMLTRYQTKYRCFNDDIQGTGAVIAAGFVNAIKVSKMHPREHRVVVFGAGSAAVGVAMNVAKLAARLYNCSVEEILRTFYLVDTKGLVTTTRGDKLAKHKVALARTDVSAEDSAKLTTLESVVEFIKPTALIGLGGVGPVFTEQIVRSVAANTARPIIFPLSNPTHKAEVIPEHAYQWTNGTAIVASGSPFPATTINGKTIRPSQGNNLYVFPGIGLGCSIAQPKNIPDDVLIAASSRLSELVDKVKLEETELYPSIDNVSDVSKHVAVAVIRKLQNMGLARSGLPTNEKELNDFVESKMWKPEYLPEEYYMTQDLHN